MQTKEVNDSLDNSIESFLFRVSPYVLLRPAQKALEWLLFRFQIHIFNVDALLTALLPFHETTLFVRVVQVYYNRQVCSHLAQFYSHLILFILVLRLLVKTYAMR